MKNSKTEKKTCKQRGEWAELCFMARAAERGLNVSRPHGDSASYDVGVEKGGRFLRVQVKSTTYRRRGSYTCNIIGPKRQRYGRGKLDFFAVYLVPIDVWYIIPYETAARNLSLNLTPRKGYKFSQYGSLAAADGLSRPFQERSFADESVPMCFTLRNPGETAGARQTIINPWRTAYKWTTADRRQLVILPGRWVSRKSGRRNSSARPGK